MTGRPAPHDRPDQGCGVSTAFHLVSFLELAPLPSAIPCARLHAVNVLHEWQLPREQITDAELLVSELMTNALAASTPLDGQPPIALRLLADRDRLVIEAWDQSPSDLDRSGAADDSESGRGLVIVEALSRRWGSRRTGYHRKVVWAELARGGPKPEPPSLAGDP